MLLVLTTKSLRILFRPVPRWISPVGYGGRSCKTNSGLPLRTSRMRSYRFSSCQAASCLGSFCGKLAFMGKSVFGRLSVFFSSSGSAMGRLSVIPFYTVISLKVSGGEHLDQREQRILELKGGGGTRQTSSNPPGRPGPGSPPAHHAA